jgi:nitroreductase
LECCIIKADKLTAFSYSPIAAIVCKETRPVTEAVYQPLEGYHEYTVEEMQTRAAEFYAHIQKRRTVRHFSDRPIPRDIIENCLLAAGTAPNGANQQPWHFAVVSNPEIKAKIREAAEEEERAFYGGRASEEWLDALSHLGTDADKPFLEIAPYLIVVFAQSYGLDAEGNKVKHYYATESVGIATGMLITAVHNAGLVSLTHTPSPMKFLNEILHRPVNERPFLILVVGYPADDVQVPVITKKPLAEIASFL